MSDIIAGERGGVTLLPHLGSQRSAGNAGRFREFRNSESQHTLGSLLRRLRNSGVKSLKYGCVMRESLSIKLFIVPISAKCCAAHFDAIPCRKQTPRRGKYGLSP